MELSSEQLIFLKNISEKYIWWKTPDDSMKYPYILIAQIMNIGTYNDVMDMVDSIGNEILIDVIRKAEIGQFNARSWHYWHYRLGLSSRNEVPDMPKRRYA